MKKSCLSAIVAALIVSVTGVGQFLSRGETPINRLIQNTTAYIKEHPDDAMGPYTLARLHYLALATGRTSFEADDSDDLPSIEETFGRIAGKGPFYDDQGKIVAPPKVEDSSLQEHLKTSVENYQKAIRMDAANPLFYLGLGSVSEAALTTGIKLGAIPGTGTAESPKDGDFAALWREQAIAAYLKAFSLTFKVEITIREKPITGLHSLISYEAGEHYLALVKARGGPRDPERETFLVVQTTLDLLDKTPRNGITPIVFNLEAARPLDDLLDPETTVAFDLDGTGRPQRYAWLQPDTGILVWDPAHAGHITSGHQLFGSVSFNMFWSDGYRALDALDDDRNGTLTGSELDGLAVWHDRNQDGVSQPGEVIPIEQTGIAALSARHTGKVGESLINTEGLTTADGRVLPTYDWTTSPIPQERPAAPRS